MYVYFKISHFIPALSSQAVDVRKQFLVSPAYAPIEYIIRDPKYSTWIPRLVLSCSLAEINNIKTKEKVYTHINSLNFGCSK